MGASPTLRIGPRAQSVYHCLSKEVKGIRVRPVWWEYARRNTGIRPKTILLVRRGPSVGSSWCLINQICWGQKRPSQLIPRRRANPGRAWGWGHKNILKKKLLPPHLMHCSCFPGRIYVEKTPEQFSLSYHHSRCTREDAWCDVYSSGCLDEEQMYGEDEEGGGYIKGRSLWR